MNKSKFVSILFLVLFPALAGCADSKGSLVSAVPPATSDPFFDSVPDQCGIETYVGPFRGYESPGVTGDTWTDGFTYQSGIGDEAISGTYEESNGSAPDPRCMALARVFSASSVSDGPGIQEAYSIALDISAVAEPFPRSVPEVQMTPRLSANLSAKFRVEVTEPCPGHPNCREDVEETQIFPVEFQCKTDHTLKRKNISDQAIADDVRSDFLDLYSLEFPDQCLFRLKNASFRLANGRTIRASIAGIAAQESDGAKLRVLRIAVSD